MQRMFSRLLLLVLALADGSDIRYPTDAAKLGNGNVLIAEAGRGRIIEVHPQTREIVWQYGAGKPTPGASAGFPTTLAIDHTAL